MDFVESNLKEKKEATLPEEAMCTFVLVRHKPVLHIVHTYSTHRHINEHTWVVSDWHWGFLWGRALASAWPEPPDSGSGYHSAQFKGETETWTQSISCPASWPAGGLHSFSFTAHPRAGQVTWLRMLPISLSVKQEQLNLCSEAAFFIISIL